LSDQFKLIELVLKFTAVRLLGGCGIARKVVALASFE
jgi:hypothetical protein